MRTALIDSCRSFHSGYGADSGDIERYEYLCPCGCGRIIEEHDNIPGFRDHDVRLLCNECAKKYHLDVSNGVRNWQLLKVEHR